MAPFFLVCFLAACHFETLQKIIHQIKQIKASASDWNVLFLLVSRCSIPNYAHKCLQDPLAKSKAIDSLGACDREVGTVLGRAVLFFFCKNDDNTKLSHVEFISTPPAFGHVEFGKIAIYVELSRYMCSSKTTSSPQIATCSRHTHYIYIYIYIYI